MAVLSSGMRKAMPKKEFAGPGRSFPVNDANHARLAISGATRSEHAGNISEGEADKIKATARHKLADGKDCPGGEACKHAVSKMHPEHVHKMMEHAMSGKAGPEMQGMAKQAMQGAPEQGEGQQAPAQSSPFSDNDSDDQQPSGGQDMPASRASMF